MKSKKIPEINLYYCGFKSEIGHIYYIWSISINDLFEEDIIGGNNVNLNYIGLGEKAFNNYLDKIAKRFYKEEPVIVGNRNRFIEEEIKNYLEKKSKEINIKPYFLIGTDFEKTVWLKLMQIPFGKTVSYKRMAELAGKPNAYRAAGTAIGKNPLLIVVPCHRVIKSSGEIGNFSGGVEIKKFLIDLES